MELLEKILAKDNMNQAYKKVVSNKGVAGVDGITVDEVDSYIRDNKERIFNKIRKRYYKPKPVLRVQIPKDNGKKRNLGIPTVMDRIIQQAMVQVLSPIFEEQFSENSYGFRPGRSCEQAVTKVLEYLNDGYEWIVDIDLERFFDTVNQDRLITIIGNLTLDGLQKRLYNLQGKRINDFGNGMCFRFADDIVTLARTERDAENFKKEIENFVNERGLVLSEEKTKIVNIKEGFDFISRFYYKSGGIVKCVPSEKAISKFEKEMEELIMNNYERWTLRKLVDNINSKITGFATYHKIEDSKDVFKHLDVVITALLLKLVKKIHPTYTDKQLINKYWSKDGESRDVFSTPGSRKKSVKFMADTLLVEERTIDLKKNIFLDRKYFKDLQKDTEIQNCIGRYRRVYDRQEGLCYFCSKPIRASDEKKIIYKQNSKDKTVRNMAYIHADCENQLLTEIKIDEDITNSITVKELLKEYSDYKITKKKYSKFRKLTEYFFNSKKKKITLKIKAIEKILGFKLCNSAYKYKTYYLSNKDGLISDSWRLNGYEVENVDLEKQEISFKKVKHPRNKIVIPKQLCRINLPKEVVNEVNSSLLHIVEKYRLK